jgi:hypothetical protein
MDEVVLDLGFEVNVMTKQIWEIMAKLKLAFSPIQLRLANQQRVISLGFLSNVLVDLEGVRSLADFEVIEIIDDSMPYPMLLGINWEFKNQAIINLKKKTMSFKVKGIRVIGPLDPALGPRYTELVTAKEEARNIDTVYKLTTTHTDYVNPTDNGMLSWRYESSCASDLEVGLENWQQRLHEVSGRQLARITKSLRQIGSEVSTIPIFDGSSDIQIFVQEYEAQVHYSERLSSLVVALRATPARWWTAHQRKITTWETCRKLLTVKFSNDTGGMD